MVVSDREASGLGYFGVVWKRGQRGKAVEGGNVVGAFQATATTFSTCFKLRTPLGQLILRKAQLPREERIISMQP
jgi:hypothetical protein